MKDKKKLNKHKSFIISLLVHLSFIGLLLTLEKKPQDQSSRPIDISLLTMENVDPTQIPLTKNMQIVDQSEPSANDDIPENAKYLSRNNQKVAEETRAALSGKFSNEAGQGLAPKGKTKQAMREKSKAEQTSITKEAMKKTEPAPWEVETQKTKSGLPTLEALKPKFDWNKMSGSESDVGVQNPGVQSATNDYLKNMKNGSQTLLNTREFVYFSYYNRIKNQLQQYWEPKIKDKVMKLFRQGRQIASDQDRITRVRITLNEKGTLIGVAVLGESGVRELDEAAIEAFRAAAPFPNPPKGITDPDGTIKIDWSFILEAGTLPVKFHAQRFEDLAY